MSSWLFNIFFDRVVQQVNERVTGKGVKLRDGNGGVWEINKYYMQMKVLVAETRDYLQYIVNEFERKMLTHF